MKDTWPCGTPRSRNNALDWRRSDAAITALREALSAPEPEPEIIRPTITRPEPDCRTCKHMMHRHFRITCGAEPCTNGNRYQELPPVRLWRTT